MGDIVYVWDLQAMPTDPDAPPVEIRPGKFPQVSGVFSPDGLRLAIGTVEATVYVWDMQAPTSSPVELYDSLAYGGGSFGRRKLSYAYYGTYGSDDGSDAYHSYGSYGSDVYHSYGSHGSDAYYSYGSHSADDGSDDGDDVATFQMSAVRFRPTSGHQYVDTASGDLNYICVFDLSAADPSESPVRLYSHFAGIKALDFSPDGLTLASSSGDFTICLWDFSDPANPFSTKLLDPGNLVTSLSFSSDGGALAAGGMVGGMLYIWDTSLPDPTAAPIYSSAATSSNPAFPEPILSVAFSQGDASRYLSVSVIPLNWMANTSLSRYTTPRTFTPPPPPPPCAQQLHPTCGGRKVQPRWKFPCDVHAATMCLGPHANRHFQRVRSASPATRSPCGLCEVLGLQPRREIPCLRGCGRYSCAMESPGR